MAQPTKTALREKLTFEQQARFDALYDRQQKKLGPATVLSMPLLGTFGFEQFYLGNAGQGILRLIFFWTLIPTVLALFEVATGDLKKQVAHANARVARRVYDEVVKNTPSPASAPASVADAVLTPNAATEAAAIAAAASAAPVAPAPEPQAPAVTETVVVAETATPETNAQPAPAEPAPSEPSVAGAASPDATPSAAPAEEAVLAGAEEQVEETTATTGTFTVAESSATWQQGMDAPVTTGDAQTFTAGTTSDAVVEIAGADATATPEAVAAPAEPSAAESAAEAEPLTDEATAATTPPLAEEGVLVFVADEDPSEAGWSGASGSGTGPSGEPLGLVPPASDVVVAETVETPTGTTTTTVEQQTSVQQESDQVTLVEGEHVESQHYHHGKLVEASRHDVLLSGEISSLLTDTTTNTLLTEVEARAAGTGSNGPAPAPWLDVSPLQEQSAAPANPAAETATTSAMAEAPSTSAEAPATPPSPEASAAPAMETPAAPATEEPAGSPAAAEAAAAPALSGLIPDGGESSGDTSGGDTSGSDTNVPGGGIGGPATDVPGGGIGDPGTGTNVPGGGIGGSGTDTGGGDTAHQHPPHDGTLPV